MSPPTKQLVVKTNEHYFLAEIVTDIITRNIVRKDT